ncbi:MAG: GTPase [Candidatus Aenigmarchaeota archaeon]|nr:GTPase [Candidatus Aenigmarchaeota archaeon]
MTRKRVVIVGALGMDFHTFNTVFRDNDDYAVVAFTMASEQNLGTTDSGTPKYPPELAGRLYPEGIPIYQEAELERIVKEKGIDEVVFAYSDVSYNEVMRKASRSLSNGANFVFVSPRFTMIRANRPVIAIDAVRTGCGKSQTSRKVTRMLKENGMKVVAIREPMPYGNLADQKCMRFETHEDLEKHNCTIEEREEYEPYIEEGLVVYAGVDYGAILEEAEKEADVIVWDGGNNEVPFYVPDVHIVVADPLRAGHELLYHPGEVNARMADYIIINKENSAKKEDIEKVEKNIRSINPSARIIHADSKITMEDPGKVKGKKVLIVEDGPTLTHGEMAFGAGFVAAKSLGCRIIDPRPFLTGSLKEVFRKFPNLGKVLPAMGYNRKQLEELEQTIKKSDCDAVIAGTPIDLSRVIKPGKPVERVKYELEEKGEITLKEVLEDFLEKAKGKAKHEIPQEPDPKPAHDSIFRKPF